MRKFRFSLNKKNSQIPFLVEAARYGDENAYHLLIERTYQSVLSYCAAMGSRQDCKDLAQETYVRIFKGNTAIIEADNPEAYMIAIAKCVCADYLKQKAKVSNLQTKLMSLNQSESSSQYETEFDETLLDGLCEEQKQVLFMVAVLGLTYSEVAQIQGVPIGTIRSRYARARENSRKILRDGTF